MVSHISFLSLMRRVMTYVSFLFVFTLQLYSQPTLSFYSIFVNWPDIDLLVLAKCGSDLRLDLTTNNFIIKENGNVVNDFSIKCPDPKRHCCLSAALVIDRSISMKWGNPSFLDKSKNGANAFIDVMDGLCDEATLISFNEQVTVDVYMTNDKVLLQQGVNSLVASGSSDIWDAGIAAIQEVVNNGSQECRAVILFTDGFDGFSKQTINDLISTALSNRIRVYTIGIGDLVNDTDLYRIADDTGGQYFKNPDASQLVTIYRRVTTIITGGPYICEIQYNAKCMDGSRRNVELTLQNLSGCPGSDKKTKSYKAPRDTSSFQPIQLSIGTSQFQDDHTASVPLILETPVNTLSGGSFYLTFDKTRLKFLGIYTKSYLLDTVRTSVKDSTNGVFITVSDPMLINRAGVLAMLNFQLTDTTTIEPCFVNIVNWNLDAGCLAPRVSQGEIVTSAPFSLIAPSGGEYFCTGGTLTIDWFRSTVHSIDIDISNDNWKTFTSVAQDVSGNSYQWQIPDTMKTGAYLLRIVEHGGNHFDISDAPFTIQSNPVITAHPSDTTSCSDSTVRFIAQCTSPDQKLIQWQMKHDSSVSWTALNNPSDTLVVADVQSWLNNIFYRAIYTNSCGLSSTTREARLTVFAPVTIIQQPTDQFGCIGKTATFHIRKDSLSQSTIQWQFSKDHGSSFVTIKNEVNEDLILQNITETMDGYLYRAFVQNKCKSILSDAGKLVLHQNIFIDSAPPSDNLCEDDSLLLTAHAMSPISFQWQRNGIDIPAETLSTFRIKHIQKNDDKAIITVNVNTPCGKIISQPYLLTVNPQTVILEQPVSQSVQKDSSVTFFVHASGTNLLYRWIKDDKIVLNDANDSSFTIPKVKSSDEGTYSVQIFDKCDKISVSDPAQLHVIVSSVTNAVMPTEPVLYQNYPNPFSNETAIGYRLLVFGFVRLELYDLLGRKIATLIDEEQDAGIHNYNFNPEALHLKLKNGVFMCVMHAGKYTLMKQIVLMR